MATDFTDRRNRALRRLRLFWASFVRQPQSVAIEPYERRLALSAGWPGLWWDDSLAALPELACQPLSPSSDWVDVAGLSDGVGGNLSGDAPDGRSLLQDALLVRQRYGLDGAGQTVAVIDSGIAWDHYGFSHPNPHGKPLVGYGVGYRVVGGWDFADDDANPYDDGPAGYHGTHVAGLIGGNFQGYQGMAPEVDLVALRVFDDFGKGSVEAIESALQWVIDHRDAFEHPITTVNLSLGVFAEADHRALGQLDQELAQLRDAGVLVVAAAGNQFDVSRPDVLSYPASHPLVTAVSSTDVGGSLSPFAQRYPGVLSAGGEAVISSVPEHVNGYDGRNDDFQPSTGTSVAAPQLAGAAVLVRQAMESLGREGDPLTILQHLRATAIERTDPLTGFSYAEVDLLSAIESLWERPGDAADQAGDTGYQAGDYGGVAQAAAFPGGVSALPESLAWPDFLQWTGDRSLQISGTSAADQIVVDFSAGVQIRVNSAVVNIDRPLEQLLIQGGGGVDSLEIIGSARGGDRVIMRALTDGHLAPSGQLENAQLTAHFSDFHTIRYVGGGDRQGDGGEVGESAPDRVTLFDSAGDDLFEASFDQATLSGRGFHFQAQGVTNVFAHGTAGGVDKAFLHDSSGDDTLAIRHQFTSLRGDGMFRLAYGFEQVYAFANQGGFDQAYLYDSPADDTLSASSHAAWISSRDYYAGARGFDMVRAESSAGGQDVARLYAGDADTSWVRSAALLQMVDGAGQIRSAHGFAHSESLSSFAAGVAPAAIEPLSLLGCTAEQEREALRSLFAGLAADWLGGPVEGDDSDASIVLTHPDQDRGRQQGPVDGRDSVSRGVAPQKIERPSGGAG